MEGMATNKMPKEPPYSPIRVKKSKADGIEAYKINEDITIQFTGKIKGIQETYDKKDFEFTIDPTECSIIHSNKKSHKANMMKKGIEDKEYEEAES